MYLEGGFGLLFAPPGWDIDGLGLAGRECTSMWDLVWIFEPTIHMSSTYQVLLAHKDIWEGGEVVLRSDLCLLQ